MTERKTFPLNKEFVLDRYRDEIIIRAEWTQRFLYEGDIADNSREKIMRYTSAIIYAMSISRLITWYTAPKANTPKNTLKRNLAKQRARALKNKWPKMPSAPRTLRFVRNKLEHFEEQMDDWASSDASNIFIDSNTGFDLDMIYIEGIGSSKPFRNIDSKGNFSILGEIVNLKEINQWCIDLVEYLK